MGHSQGEIAAAYVAGVSCWMTLRGGGVRGAGRSVSWPAVGGWLAIGCRRAGGGRRAGGLGGPDVGGRGQQSGLDGGFRGCGGALTQLDRRL